MRSPAVVSALVAGLLMACSPRAAEPTMETDEQKTLYALGLAISRNLVPFDFSQEELALIQAGLADGAQRHDPRVSIEVFGPRIDAMLRERSTRIAEKEKKAGEAYRGEMAAEAGAVTTPSGVIYREIEAGDGAVPSASDTVQIHYHGTLRDGTVFDSSRAGDAPTPATFPLSGVISCFRDGVGMMKVGGKSKLTCPPETAYGEKGSPPNIPPGATLTFEVELLQIVSAEPAGPQDAP